MTSVPPNPFMPPPETPQGSGLYATPGEGLKAVKDDYHYWTGKLTESSFQLSLGVIVANWTVFSSVEGVLGNFWAKISLFLILLCLAINLFTAWYMGELHRKIVEHAESNLNNWKEEFSRTTGNDPWPFTRKIEIVGRLTRGLKALLPIAAGITFVVALVCS